MKRRTFLTAATGAAAITMRSKTGQAEQSVSNTPISTLEPQKKAQAIFARDAAYKPKSNTEVGRRILAGAPPNVRGYGQFSGFLNDVAYGRIRVPDASIAIPENVAVYADVSFAAIGDKELKLDLFVPKKPKNPVPLVVLIHGGCWLAGTRKDYDRYAVDIAKLELLPKIRTSE